METQTSAPRGFDVDFVKEFMTQRQGKWAVSYAGLLHLAHERGLVGIETNVLQFPTADNGMTCVVRADVRLERDGKAYTFADVGDANAGNVTKMVAQHIIRMASTRAKARALRDAVNIGVTALEELAEDAEEAKLQPQAPRANNVVPLRGDGRIPLQPSAPAPNGHSNGHNGTNGQAHAPSGIATPSVPDLRKAADGQMWELTFDSLTWRVPQAIADLPSSSLQAYISWVRKVQGAQTLGALGDAWKIVEPAAAAMSAGVHTQIKSVFTWRKEQLQKAARVAAKASPGSSAEPMPEDPGD